MVEALQITVAEQMTSEWRRQHLLGTATPTIVALQADAEEIFTAVGKLDAAARRRLGNNTLQPLPS